MIPYLDIPALPLVGPLKVQPFGALVALGLATGYAVARREARRRGLDEARVSDLVLWTVVGGFVLAHLVSALLYFPDEVARDPWALLRIWDSLSSYGGFAGGALGAMLAIRRYRLPLWPTVDTLAVALIAGWFFGRLGCTVAHDHPGRLSDFFLAVNYPGGARHDLGFDEWLFTLALNVAVFLLLRRDPPAGSVLALLMIAYAPVRFGLDFLRTADRHYLGLTPGQYFSVALLIGGLLVLRRVRARGAVQPK